MSALKTPAKSSGRVIVAYSILVIGLALSARLIFGGALFPQSSPVSVERTDQSTMLASLESTRSIPPAASTRRIESIRVGERVLAENPEIAPEERARWQEPDWQDWLHLTLQMPLPTDQEDANPPILDIEILRPEQWVVDQLGVIVAQDEDAPAAGEYDWFEFADSESALVPYSPLRPTYRYVAEMYAIAEVADAEVLGLTVDIDLPEMGAVGTAMVSAIQPCPPVKSSAGQVVTATFAHPPTRQVLDVVFEGESDAIGVTDNHLFWSVDRQEFVPIGNMEIGERVVTFHGDTKRIESRLPRPGPQLVYNLEVYGEHVYFVGQQGLLVHNAYSRTRSNEELLVDGQVPGRRGGQFHRWFDSLTPDEFDQLWSNPAVQSTIRNRLLFKGGHHEWLVRSRANVFKRWGLSVKDIANTRQLTNRVNFANNPFSGSPGGHVGAASQSKIWHDELIGIVDSSTSFSQFRRRLNNFADYRLDGGRRALPRQLRE